jgi:hypothetical protein
MRARHAGCVGITALLLGGARPVAAAVEACAEGDVTPACTKEAPPASQGAPDLTTMKVPEAPASMAIGMSPSEIQRPGTPTEFGLALAGGIARAFTSPLDNFAVQASPYWLFRHPNLTGADLDHHTRWAALRNFSLSAGAAAVKLTDETGNPLDAKRWAVGARTTLFPGWQSSAALECQRALVAALDEGSGQLATARAAFQVDWDRHHPQPAVTLTPGPNSQDPKFSPNGAFDEAAFETARKAWVAARERALKAKDQTFTAWAKDRDAALATWLVGYAKKRKEDPELQRCLTVLHERVGFMAEVAGAFSMTLPGGDFQQMPALRTRQQTTWLTAGYVFNRNPRKGWRPIDVSLLGLGRYQREARGEGDGARRIDGGGRVVVAWDRYGASVEGTYRREKVGALPARNLSRFACTLDVRLMGGAWGSVTFGKDFGGPGTTPLIALANLQWNLGVERQLSLDTPLAPGAATAEPPSSPTPAPPTPDAPKPQRPPSRPPPSGTTAP